MGRDTAPPEGGRGHGTSTERRRPNLAADTDIRDDGGLCGAGLRGHYGGEGAVPHRRLHEPGDTVVLLSGYLLGPGAPLAGSIGPAWRMYCQAPPILRTRYPGHQRQGWRLCGGGFGASGGSRRTGSPGPCTACGIVEKLPMVVGYWLYDGPAAGGGAAGAEAGIPSNLEQAASASPPPTLLAAALDHGAHVRRSSPAVIPQHGKKAPRRTFGPASEEI